MRKISLLPFHAIKLLGCCALLSCVSCVKDKNVDVAICIEGDCSDGTARLYAGSGRKALVSVVVTGDGGTYYDDNYIRVKISDGVLFGLDSQTEQVDSKEKLIKAENGTVELLVQPPASINNDAYITAYINDKPHKRKISFGRVYPHSMDITPSTWSADSTSDVTITAELFRGDDEPISATLPVYFQASDSTGVISPDINDVVKSGLVDGKQMAAATLKNVTQRSGDVAVFAWYYDENNVKHIDSTTVNYK